MIVNEGEAQVNYRFIEIESEFKQCLDGHGYKQNDFHLNISMKSYIMNIW